MFTGTLYIQFQRKKLKETVLVSNLLHLQIEIASRCRENEKLWVLVTLNVVKLMNEILFIFSLAHSVLHESSKMCCSITRVCPC
jgi:hypothetical protein